MTKTLFGRTSLIITSTMLAFLITTITIAGYFIILPVGKRNAEDLASLILLSAKTYVELPPETKQDFINELSTNHQLYWGTGNEQLAKHIHLKPHFNFMEGVLSTSLGSSVNIAPEVGNSDRHWVDINVSGKLIRIGFDQQRTGAVLPYVALYLVSILAVMAILSSLVLMRKITKPVQALSKAAKIIGSGGVPKPLLETGPKELAETAKAFNKMSVDVQNLLENRTVILGGISHDLRTPLTRMRMALEMLPDNVDNELRNELKDSIANMELIIQEYMQLTQDLENNAVEGVNIHKLLSDIVNKKGQLIKLSGDLSLTTNTHLSALHRVLFNLVENAIRYGNSKPTRISWKFLEKTLNIEVSDQGCWRLAFYLLPFLTTVLFIKENLNN